jgi:hypothetical protein
LTSASVAAAGFAGAFAGAFAAIGFMVLLRVLG